MRLVDKSEVEELMKCYGFHAPDMTITEFIEDELTTISAVPVVRCRECIHYREYRTCRYKQPIRECVRMARHDMEFRVKPDDFCSYGQRKKDEQ